MDYYKRKQFLAQVDKNDKIIGKIEKWEAHKKGVLHRGYTCILIYKGNYILQHRKHPVFDGVFDFSFSSHQLYVRDQLQDDLTAIYNGFKREWNLEKKDLISQPKFLKKIYYKDTDPNSDYTEHEIDYIYAVELKKIPSPSFDFAYGYKLVKKLEIRNWKLVPSKIEGLEIKFAPWVKVMIKKNDII